jgi:RNA polymerase sigma factor (sigma-70 family)
MWDDEHILLKRFARTGDAEAFSEILRRHAGMVYGTCLRVLEDRDRAADAAQETFFQLLRSAGKITGSVPSWLHRVAIRKAINVMQSETSRRRREAKYAASKPKETKQWEDVSRYVDEALDELDEEIRGILIQHFFGGRTTQDIASDKGTSQPTVSRRIESGVTELRRKLEQRGVIVPAVVLGTLLSENAVEAAPAVVLKELGKIALVGGKAAAGAGASAAGGGVSSGITGKIVTAAAVAAVGVGGVVVYKDITQSAKEPGAPIVREVDRRESEEPTRSLEGQESAEIVRIDRKPRKVTLDAGGPGDDENITSSSQPKAGNDDDAHDGYRRVNGDGGRSHAFGLLGGPSPKEKEEPDTKDSNSPPPPPGGLGGPGGG